MSRYLTLLLIAFLPTASRCFAADDPFLRWMDAIAQKQLDQREAKISAIRNPADAARRQSFARAKILELIGGLPDYTGPLNPRVTGEIRQPGYVIEKVIFESLPRVFVTANLYRPDKLGKFPGILLPLGHWEYGKPAVQRIAGNLALKGFVALTYDPLGQGERQQLYDRRYENSLADHGTEEHLLAGGLSVLLGQSFARYRIWDAKRALDYLVSRPEVITDRIGCTGCSGGGTLTTYISALDARIKVAAPACYINSFRQLFSGPVGDSEQSLPNFISAGLDLADYIELFAPKPWLISSTREDFFPLEGARHAYEEAKRWYYLYGAEDKIKWAVGPGGHGTPLVIREAIYDWMIRWLRDGDGSATEQPVALLAEHALWATPSGQVADLEGSREVFDVLREEKSKRQRQGSREELAALIRTLVNREEPPIDLKTVVLKPEGGQRSPAVLLVDTTGTVPQLARDLVEKGSLVMVLTPRGLPAESSRSYSGDWITNVRAWLIGYNLPAMRARDILRGYELLKNRPDVDSSKIRGEANGIAGIWLMMAAAVEPGIQTVWVNHTPYSFSRAFENPLTRNLHSAVIPGFSLQWDISDLLDPSRIQWTDPGDWLGRVVPLKGNYIYSPASQ